MNIDQINISKDLFGDATIDMLMKSNEDAFWILENFGVGCKQPDMISAFKPFEEKGLAIVHEDRVYVTKPLVEKCLETVPKVSDFFVPLNSYFIGGTAPYIYDDKKKTRRCHPD